MSDLSLAARVNARWYSCSLHAFIFAARSYGIEERDPIEAIRKLRTLKSEVKSILESSLSCHQYVAYKKTKFNIPFTSLSYEHNSIYLFERTLHNLRTLTSREVADLYSYEQIFRTAIVILNVKRYLFTTRYLLKLTKEGIIKGTNYKWGEYTREFSAANHGLGEMIKFLTDYPNREDLQYCDNCMELLSYHSISVIVIWDNIGKKMEEFFSFIIESNLNNIKNCIKRSLQIREWVDKRTSREYTLVHWAASIGSESIIGFFIDSGVDLNCQDAEGINPLYVACRLGHDKIVQLLLKGESDERRRVALSCKDTLGNSPLHVAAEAGHLKTVQLLIQNGAILNGLNNDNMTPLDLAKTAERKLTVQWLSQQKEKTD